MDKYDMVKLLSDGKTNYVDEFLSTSESASATGFTGLTPSAVTDTFEAESYNTLYGYPKQGQSTPEKINP